MGKDFPVKIGGNILCTFLPFLEKFFFLLEDLAGIVWRIYVGLALGVAQL